MIKKQYKVGYFEDPNDVDSYVECNGEYLDASDVVGILKELQEENNQLKDKLSKYDSIAEKICEWDFDEIIKVLEAQQETEKENEKLKKENKHLRCTIESNSQDDYIDYLKKQNERLKERIEELVSNDKILFMNE